MSFIQSSLIFLYDLVLLFKVTNRIITIFNENYKVKNKIKMFDTAYGSATGNFPYVKLGIILLWKKHFSISRNFRDPFTKYTITFYAHWILKFQIYHCKAEGITFSNVCVANLYEHWKLNFQIGTHHDFAQALEPVNRRKRS